MVLTHVRYLPFLVFTLNPFGTGNDGAGFQSKELIVKAGLRLGDVDQYPNIDVTIDGADE